MTSPIVGVDVGGTSTRAVSLRRRADAADLGRRGPTPRGAAAIADLVARLVGDRHRQAVRRGHRHARRVDPPAASSARPSTSASTAPATIVDLVASRLGVPVHVENDVNAAALGAFAHLGLAPAQSLAYVNVGTGIAAGFVLAGRLWRGALGRSRRDRPRPDATPTARRAAAGRPGAPRRSGRAAPSPTTVDGADDVVAATAWAVQLCVMTLDVDVVAVGGGMTRPAEVFLPALLAAIARREQASPMLADLGISRRVVLAPADVPLGSLGAVLAAREAVLLRDRPDRADPEGRHEVA